MKRNQHLKGIAPLTKSGELVKGKKGASGRGPKITLAEKGIKAVDKVLVLRYIAQNSHLTIGELKEKLSKENREHIPLLEYMIIKVMLVCAQTGDPHRLNAILDRTIGKVAQEVKISKGDDLASMSDEELEAERRKYVEESKLHLQWQENSERYQEMVRRFQEKVKKDQEELNSEKSSEEIIELTDSDVNNLDIEEGEDD